MKRRAVLAAAGFWLAAVAVQSRAQTQVRLRRIAFLHPGTESGWRPRIETFRTALRDLGYVEGRDISIEVRWANDETQRLGPLAAQIAASNPAIIVTAGSAGVAACKKATSTIPIVFVTASNPVEQGFVASLARPGGNITGLMLYLGTAAKTVELVREALPGTQRLAILVHEAAPDHRGMLEEFNRSAHRFKFEPVIVRVTRFEDLDRAFLELAEQKAEALFLPNHVFFVSHRSQIAELALKARIPLFSNSIRVVESGGLMTYGAPRDHYHRAAALVDKILRGAKPADIPIEQPELLYLVVNRKTAKAIGVTLSPVTMLRADRFID